MKLNYLSETFFPFLVPEMDSSFASNVGPQTVYPAGFSLDKALQIYWRAQNYALTASGDGTLGSLTQSLSVSENLPPRNAGVGTNTYYEVDGFNPAGPGDLVVGYGMRAVIPGSGTITSSGPGPTGTNPGALFNLQVNLFYPEIFSPDPVIRFAGKWWPAMSVSCSMVNTVTLSSGGTRTLGFDCTTFDPASTTEIGTFTFFGISVPVFCAGLVPARTGVAAETRSFTGTLSVANEWA